MTTVPINPSPKTRFQLSTDNIAKHKHLLDLAELQRGFDFALMQCQVDWAVNTKDQTSAMVSGIKMQGVLEFLTTFQLLAQTAPKTTPVVMDNLAGNRQ